eukprot:6459685-Amphidinium_carterae.2
MSQGSPEVSLVVASSVHRHNSGMAASASAASDSLCTVPGLAAILSALSRCVSSISVLCVAAGSSSSSMTSVWTMRCVVSRSALTGRFTAVPSSMALVVGGAFISVVAACACNGAASSSRERRGRPLRLGAGAAAAAFAAAFLDSALTR